MSSYTMYRCNICTDFIQPTDSSSKAGFGLFFPSDLRGFTFQPANRCDKHICLQCARNIHDEMRKIMPGERHE